LNIFVFLGGFTLTSHLTFVARENKGRSFAAFINYLFIFSILYILNLTLLELYLKIAFRLHIGEILIEGIKGGTTLIQNVFTQALS